MAGGCGDIANVLGQLGLNLNESSIQNLVSNWQGMALPAALYLLSSYLPMAKEALMGARTLSQFVANIGGMNCEAMMNQVARMSLADSRLVTQCINSKIGTGEGKSEAQITAAFEQCIRNPGAMSLVKALGGDPDKIGRFVSFLDPQSFARCAAKNAGIPDLTNASHEELKKASFRDRLANIAVLAMPTIDVSVQDGEFRYSTMKIGGREISFLEYLTMVQAYLENDVDELIKNISASEDEQEMVGHLNEFGNKYNLNLSGVRLLLELVTQWGKKIDQQMKVGKIFTPQDAICKSRYRKVKERYLKDVLFRKALVALKTGLLSKMSAFEQTAANAAALGGAFGCKGADDKKISEETVKAITRAKNNAIAQIDAKLDMLPSDETACREIGQAIKECLNAGMQGIITLEDDRGEPAFWYIGDNCFVSRSIMHRTGEPRERAEDILAGVDRAFAPPTPGTPIAFDFAFGTREFALLGLIFLGLAIIYFGVLIVRAVSREEWAVVGINGAVSLVLIGMMINLLG
jgi:hypothetical protein